MSISSILPQSNSGQTFDFFGQDVRIVLDNEGKPWFVASDVCAILEITNTRNVYHRIPDSEKDVRPVDTLGGPQQMVVVNEPGLYRLIFRSDKPQAETFKTWVFEDVLPSINHTGQYAMQTKTTAEMFALQAQFNLEAERKLTDHEERITDLEARGALDRYYALQEGYEMGINHQNDPRD